MPSLGVLITQALLVVVLLYVVLGVGRFVVAWADERTDVREAVVESTDQQVRIATAVVAFVTGVLVDVGMLADGVTAWIASHPFASSNVLGIGIGSLGLAGVLQVSPEVFLLGGLAVTVGVLLLRDIRS
jgi:hypothetical protein